MPKNEKALEVSRKHSFVTLQLKDIPATLVITQSTLGDFVYGEKHEDELGIHFNKNSVRVSQESQKLIMEMAKKCEHAGRKMRLYIDDIDNKVLGIGFRSCHESGSGWDSTDYYVTDEGKLVRDDIDRVIWANPEDFHKHFTQFIANMRYALGEGAATAAHIKHV